MSKVKFVGAEVREGTYQDHPYKNYILYYVENVKSDNILFGVCPQSLKVKAKFVDENNISIKSLNQKVGEIYFDRYGNLTKIDLDE